DWLQEALAPQATRPALSDLLFPAFGDSSPSDVRSHRRGEERPRVTHRAPQTGDGSTPRARSSSRLPPPPLHRTQRRRRANSISPPPSELTPRRIHNLRIPHFPFYSAVRLSGVRLWSRRPTPRLRSYSDNRLRTSDSAPPRPALGRNTASRNTD